MAEHQDLEILGAFVTVLADNEPSYGADRKGKDAEHGGIVEDRRLNG